MIAWHEIPSPTLPMETRIERLIETYICKESTGCRKPDCPVCELKGAYNEGHGIMTAALESFLISASVGQNVVRSDEGSA